jgi:hypothetical protein
MSIKPYILDNINLDNIIFTNTKGMHNNKIILIKYNDNNKIKNFVFQLPTLINNHTIENNNFEINLECNNTNNTNKIVNFFNNLDNKIICESKKNIIWFNHLINKSQIKYKKIIKDTEQCINGCINLKLNNNIDFKTKISVNNYNNILPNDILHNDILPNDGSCQIILECYAIFINNNSEFELILRPIILSFKLSYNYEIIESDVEDEIDNENLLFIKSELY